MSARCRPQRRVRGRDREALLLAWFGRAVALDSGWTCRRWQAHARGCRPAQLRRCLLGLPVSARAAARILAAAGLP